MDCQPSRHSASMQAADIKTKNKRCAKCDAKIQSVSSTKGDGDE